MYRKGHLGICLALYAPIALLTLIMDPSAIWLVGLGYLVTIKTASLPDIDLYIQRLQRKLPDFIYNRLPYRITHRGITHTVFFALFVGISIAVIVVGSLSLARPYVEGLSLIDAKISMADTTYIATYLGFVGCYGTISHFIGDVITPTGLKPFHPVSNKRYRRTITMPIVKEESKAKSSVWNTTFLMLGIASTGLVLLGAVPEYRSMAIETIVNLV